MITRRGMLLGLLATPAVIRTPGLLMPVRTSVWTPPTVEVVLPPVLVRSVSWAHRYVVEYTKENSTLRWYRVDEDGTETEVPDWKLVAPPDLVGEDQRSFRDEF